MLGRTHAKGGEVAALGGYTLLSSAGVLDQIPVMKPLSFLIIYPFAIWASTAPDLDHGKQSIPSKDVVSRSIWYVLHATTGLRKKMSKTQFGYNALGVFDAKHRSWQTHSYEALFALVFLAYWLCTSEIAQGIGQTQSAILRLVALGLALGWLAHIVLDGITPDGIHIATCCILNDVVFKGKKTLPETIKVVPQTQFFATGGGNPKTRGNWYWEKIVYTVLQVTAWVLLFWMVLGWLGLV